jgi:hypothetical protein
LTPYFYKVHFNIIFLLCLSLPSDFPSGFSTVLAWLKHQTCLSWNEHVSCFWALLRELALKWVTSEKVTFISLSVDKFSERLLEVTHKFASCWTLLACSQHSYCTHFYKNIQFVR